MLDMDVTGFFLESADEVLIFQNIFFFVVTFGNYLYDCACCKNGNFYVLIL